MAETILSVGIDVGTSTTEVVFSRLSIENTAGAFLVPKITIVDKTIVYRSQIYRTPLLSPDVIDAERLAQIVSAEYASAGYTPADIRTGAAIITGETARANNASSVLESLSGMAGDFVVASAGPDLESVLAARGAGIDEYSKESTATIANLDIGGGTTNIAVYRFGKLLGVSCLDIGGRLIRIHEGKISYIFDSVARLAALHGIDLAIGERADEEKISRICDLMADQLAASINLIEREAIHDTLYTNDGKPLSEQLRPQQITFSGGVADLITPQLARRPFEFDDIGPLLGRAIARNPHFQKVTIRQGVETIGATVVGAGVHTTEISGSTIAYARDRLPITNVPILRINSEDEHLPGRLAQAIKDEITLHSPDDPSQSVAIAISGDSASTFVEVQRIASEILEGAASIVNGPHALIVMVEQDRAKVLGQTMAIMRGSDDGIICIDSVQASGGDFIDIGEPVGDGRAVPVVVKTLIFNSR